jgi:hypothetical protein
MRRAFAPGWTWRRQQHHAAEAQLTGITGLRALMGFNEVEAAILDALDGAAQGPKLSHNPRRIGLRQAADRVVDLDQDQHLLEDELSGLITVAAPVW